ncbi:MAG: OsmC family protein [Planctomycetota bacterium]|jgi:uncharacterized OsmC-like protein
MAEQQTIKVSNGVDMDMLWKSINSVKEKPELGRSKFCIRNKWFKGGYNKSTVMDFHTIGEECSHKTELGLEADEPEILAGTDKGPNPVEHLLNALAACLTTSMVYHAATRGIEIEELESHLEGELDLQGFMGLSPDVRKGYENIRVTFRVKTDPENIETLRELAEFSPVFDVVRHGTKVDLRIEHM